jgi:hypothetical protein
MVSPLAIHYTCTQLHTHTGNPTQTKQTINKNKSQLSNRKKPKTLAEEKNNKIRPWRREAVLRDPTAHPESAAEIKKKMSARLEIELEMNTYIQDYVYTLKGVGGGRAWIWCGLQPSPSHPDSFFVSAELY